MEGEPWGLGGGSNMRSFQVASKPMPPAAAGKAAAPPVASAGKETKSKKGKEPASVEKPSVEAAKKPGLSQMSMGSFFSKSPAGAPATPKLAKPATPVADKAAEKVSEKENAPVAPVVAEKEVVLKTPVKEKGEDASPSSTVKTPESTAANAASGEDKAQKSSREGDLIVLGSEEPAACSAGTPPTAVKAAAEVAEESAKKPSGDDAKKPAADNAKKPEADDGSDDDCMVVDDAPPAPAAASKVPSRRCSLRCACIPATRVEVRW